MAEEMDHDIEQMLQPLVALLSVMQADERAKWVVWLIDQVSLAARLGSKEHHEFLAALHARLVPRSRLPHSPPSLQTTMSRLCRLHWISWLPWIPGRRSPHIEPTQNKISERA